MPYGSDISHQSCQDYNTDQDSIGHLPPESEEEMAMDPPCSNKSLVEHCTQPPENDMHVFCPPQPDKKYNNYLLNHALTLTPPPLNDNPVENWKHLLDYEPAEDLNDSMYGDDAVMHGIESLVEEHEGSEGLSEEIKIQNYLLDDALAPDYTVIPYPNDDSDENLMHISDSELAEDLNNHSMW